MDDDALSREIDDMFKDCQSCGKDDPEGLRRLRIHDPELEYLRRMQEIDDLGEAWDKLVQEDPSLINYQDLVYKTFGLPDKD